MSNISKDGYAEITEMWEKSYNELRDGCSENTKDLIEQANENCKRLLGI